MFGYLHLFRAAGDILAFGFALAFLAAFGQTFFVALFVTEVRASFGLSHGSFGSIFSIATLASGLLMIWIGGLIDRMPAGPYATLGMLGLAAAALLFALAPNPLVLGLALFLLRMTGQGMLSHAATTTMARLDAPVRGKALSIAQLGHPTAQAVFPALVLASIALLGWRPTWGIAAAIAGASTLVLVVVRRQRLDRRLDETVLPIEAGAGARPSSDRRAMLADWRFYWLLPSIIVSSAVGTGLVFHQRLIAEVKGWALSLLAASMAVNALAGIAGSVIAGLLIDRFRAVALLPYYLLGMAAAGLLLGGTDHPTLAPVFFGLIGFSAGAGHTVTGAVYAEIYGTRHLGAIRAMVHAIMVCASALTPGLMGMMLDADITVEAIGIASGVLLVAISIANLRLLGAVPRH